MRGGTELGRVRGLGSAHVGVDHWWHQRLTAGANLLLMAWLLISIARMGAYDYASMHAWLSSGWVAVPMALLVLSVFWHARLGLQVVIEDYAHHEGRVVLLVLLNVFVIALGATAVFAILKVALGASA